MTTPDYHLEKSDDDGVKPLDPENFKRNKNDFSFNCAKQVFNLNPTSNKKSTVS